MAIRRYIYIASFPITFLGGFLTALFFNSFQQGELTTIENGDYERHSVYQSNQKGIAHGEANFDNVHQYSAIIILKSQSEMLGLEYDIPKEFRGGYPFWLSDLKVEYLRTKYDIAFYEAISAFSKEDIDLVYRRALPEKLDFLPLSVRESILNINIDRQKEIADLTRNKRIPSIDSIRKINNKFDIQIEDLLTPTQKVEYDLRFGLTSNMLRNVKFNWTHEKFISVYSILALGGADQKKTSFSSEEIEEITSSVGDEGTRLVLSSFSTTYARLNASIGPENKDLDILSIYLAIENRIKDSEERNINSEWHDLEKLLSEADPQVRRNVESVAESLISNRSGGGLFRSRTML